MLNNQINHFGLASEVVTSSLKSLAGFSVGLSGKCSQEFRENLS